MLEVYKGFIFYCDLDYSVVSERVFELTFFFILLLLFELHETSKDSASDDEKEIEIEPHVEIHGATFNRFNDCEFVREAASIEGDTAEEEV